MQTELTLRQKTRGKVHIVTTITYAYAEHHQSEATVGKAGGSTLYMPVTK
jgi:hypothetical protein